MDVNKFQLKMETAAGIIEVAQAEPETVTQRLNRLAREAGYDNISPYAIEVLGWEEDQTSTTLLFNRDSDEPYTLVAPIAGRIRHYNNEGLHQVPEDYYGPVGVHRAMMSYSSATRINNVTDMKTTLQPIINLGIMDLINQFGNISHGYNISMEMPGYTPSFFRDLDDLAAYEIRLFLYKE